MPSSPGRRPTRSCRTPEVGPPDLGVGHSGIWQESLATACTARLLAARGIINISILLIGATIGVILGDMLGYRIGKSIGPKLFAREDSIFFKRQYLVRAREFTQKHGKKTIFLARYIPVVRTFAPVVAGAGEMPYRSFLIYNIAGGIAWCLTVGLAGYFLGSKIPNIDAYILPIVVAVVVLSFVPVIREVIINRKK